MTSVQQLPKCYWQPTRARVITVGKFPQYIAETGRSHCRPHHVQYVHNNWNWNMALRRHAGQPFVISSGIQYLQEGQKDFTWRRRVNRCPKVVPLCSRPCSSLFNRDMLGSCSLCFLEIFMRSDWCMLSAPQLKHGILNKSSSRTWIYSLFISTRSYNYGRRL